MVRLILTLTPIVCVLSAITFSQVFEVFLDEHESEDAASTNTSPPPGDSSNVNTDKNLYDKPTKNRKVSLQSSYNCFPTSIPAIYSLSFMKLTSIDLISLL